MPDPAMSAAVSPTSAAHRAAMSRISEVGSAQILGDLSDAASCCSPPASACASKADHRHLALRDAETAMFHLSSCERLGDRGGVAPLVARDGELVHARLARAVALGDGRGAVGRAAAGLLHLEQPLLGVGH